MKLIKKIKKKFLPEIYFNTPIFHSKPINENEFPTINVSNYQIIDSKIHQNKKYVILLNKPICR
jgi:hypothetical protein